MRHPACRRDRKARQLRPNLASPRSDRSTWTSLLLALLTAATACKATEPSPSPETALVVFAAASLRTVFEELGEGFEQAHAGLELTFNFAGTQELRTQLEQGAAVDVFASADQRHMDALLKTKHVVEPATFARNEPVLVVAKDQETKLKAFSDLPRAQRLVIGTPEVPIGRYTLQVLDNASQKLGPDFRKQVEAKVVSRELNVKQVLAKVTLGEADAGIVYRTDALAATGRVAVVDIPAGINLVAKYPIAVAADAAHPKLAREWVELVLSERGRAALERAGFLAP
jgi:molybdate transport system substrate-binding protein